MVSNFKFYSGKDINLRKSVSFSAVVGITFGLVALFMLSSTLPQMLFLLFRPMAPRATRSGSTTSSAGGPSAKCRRRRPAPDPPTLSLAAKAYIFQGMHRFQQTSISPLSASLLLAGLLLRR